MARQARRRPGGTARQRAARATRGRADRPGRAGRHGRHRLARRPRRRALDVPRPRRGGHACVRTRCGPSGSTATTCTSPGTRCSRIPSPRRRRAPSSWRVGRARGSASTSRRGARSATPARKASARSSSRWRRTSCSRTRTRTSLRREAARGRLDPEARRAGLLVRRRRACCAARGRGRRHDGRGGRARGGLDRRRARPRARGGGAVRAARRVDAVARDARADRLAASGGTPSERPPPRSRAAATNGARRGTKTARSRHGHVTPLSYRDIRAPGVPLGVVVRPGLGRADYPPAVEHLIRVADEVQAALSEERAVVALETTLVAHGFPAPPAWRSGSRARRLSARPARSRPRSASSTGRS